jgi:hypothetical protein
VAPVRSPGEEGEDQLSSIYTLYPRQIHKVENFRCSILYNFLGLANLAEKIPKRQSGLDGHDLAVFSAGNNLKAREGHPKVDFGQ